MVKGQVNISAVQKQKCAVSGISACSLIIEEAGTDDCGVHLQFTRPLYQEGSSLNKAQVISTWVPACLCMEDRCLGRSAQYGQPSCKCLHYLLFSDLLTHSLPLACRHAGSGNSLQRRSSSGTALSAVSDARRGLLFSGVTDWT